MKRFVIWLLLLAMLLACPAAAQDSSGLEQVVKAYMAENGLSEENFSLSYYNTVTGESYAFNDKKFMIAASTYKLPVNMYFYEMEQAGEIESDAFIPRAGMNLDQAHRLSLVDSNNEVSIGMLYTIGGGLFREYKEKMRKYFTLPDEEIDPNYYADNYYCTNMMMDALKYLYENRDRFEEMIGYMKQAQQDHYFCAGVTEYEVAHKYGWFDGMVNDVGIIYTEEPFLLAVYTKNVYESIVGEVAALVTQYNVEQAMPKEIEVFLPVEMVPAEPEEEATPPAEEVIVEEITPDEPEKSSDVFAWWMLPVALGVFVLGGGGTVLLTRKKWMQQMLQDEENKDEN